MNALAAILGQNYVFIAERGGHGKYVPIPQQRSTNRSKWLDAESTRINSMEVYMHTGVANSLPASAARRCLVYLVLFIGRILNNGTLHACRDMTCMHTCIANA